MQRQLTAKAVDAFLSTFKLQYLREKKFQRGSRHWAFYLTNPHCSTSIFNTDGVILCIIIGDVHQYIGYCLILLDPCICCNRQLQLIQYFFQHFLLIRIPTDFVSAKLKCAFNLCGLYSLKFGSKIRNM